MPGTYSVIGSGSSDFDVKERTLASNAGGTLLSSSGDSSVLEDGDSRIVILEREYDVDGTYDFSDFMSCSTESISVISAYGSSDSFGYHSRRTAGTAGNDCCESEVEFGDGVASRVGWGSIMIGIGVLIWMR